ncbi:hypothetical protein VTN96DRAFT_368 [Rasamsonia emersonii]
MPDDPGNHQVIFGDASRDLLLKITAKTVLPSRHSIAGSRGNRRRIRYCTQRVSLPRYCSSLRAVLHLLSSIAGALIGGRRWHLAGRLAADLGSRAANQPGCRVSESFPPPLARAAPVLPSRFASTFPPSYDCPHSLIRNSSIPQPYSFLPFLL